ncbi:MAG: hypothetical protein M1820_006985 [Bogoriella megaspora]|nr:MAG: hypothetical protein M1820_006985 [Bogoriella megaspora]
MATATTVQALANDLSANLSTLTSQNKDDVALRKDTISKAKRLVKELYDPIDYTMDQMQKMMELVCVRAVIEMKALQAIPSEGTASLDDIATSTGAQKALLERLLRMLVGSRLLVQTADGRYAHTRISESFTGFPGEVFGMGHDEIFAPMAKLPQYFEAEGGFFEPTSSKHNPYSWSHGMNGKNVWDIMGQWPKRVERFQRCMVGITEKDPLTGFYDFGKLDIEGDRTIFVDVGGSQGQTIRAVLEAHPNIDPSRVVLQDQPDVIAIAKSSDYLPASVNKMAHDFFTPQPVKNARAYYMRRVTHDWSDADVEIMFKHIANAMAPDSKLLVSDVVLPSRIENDAHAFFAWNDIGMMVMGGKERTKELFEELLGKAGLKLDHIYHVEAGNRPAIVEASLK